MYVTHHAKRYSAVSNIPHSGGVSRFNTEGITTTATGEKTLRMHHGKSNITVQEDHNCKNDEHERVNEDGQQWGSDQSCH